MSPEAEERPGVSGRILVVDDNEMNRDVLSRRLERQGHSVVTAEDGAKALEVLREKEIDAVLLDIMMPNMDGYQVLEAMKADPQLRHVPVIMITAVDAVESVVRCIQMGAEDYLPKPFNKDILKARLTSCLERKRLRDQEAALLRQLAAEKARSDELLHVILPDAIVEELKATNEVRPRRFENVAVLFSDIVGFTKYCDKSPPEEVVAHLQTLTTAFEEIALRHRVQKIKTIGDAFMATAGLLEPVDNPVLHCVRCGLEMVEATKASPPAWSLRVGIHVGPVMAGVVGKRQYLFDLWGDTVNTAQRMESNAPSDGVAVSAAAWEQIAHVCTGESLGRLVAKGKGEMEIYRVAAVTAA
jgi:CheY-like chemotaxis protein